jgi:hypothetical protein
MLLLLLLRDFLIGVQHVRLGAVWGNNVPRGSQGLGRKKDDSSGTMTN